ncbi:MAG: hypothetical protein VKM01_03750 [Cyanobacteriota bacterium]|nr:hypothetical protein [Cyanobacteriota bacterium]
MLPAIPAPSTPQGDPAQARRPRARPPVAPLQALAPLLALALLLLGLTGCGAVGGGPPRGQLIAALELQIQLTQGAIASALGLPSAGLPEVSRVRVNRQERLPIGDGQGLHLSGRFDWRLSGDAYRTDTPFELYLQRGERGQSWRLARPIGADADGVQQWITDPLPLRS